MEEIPSISVGLSIVFPLSLIGILLYILCASVHLCTSSHQLAKRIHGITTRATSRAVCSSDNM